MPSASHASPVTIGTVLPMDGSERYRFRCHRLQKNVRQNSLCRRADHGKSCRHFRFGQQGRCSDHIPPEEPSESPRHFADNMDESVIVGYYTLRKCLSEAPRCLQILKKEGKNIWQEMME